MGWLSLLRRCALLAPAAALVALAQPAAAQVPLFVAEPAPAPVPEVAPQPAATPAEPALPPAPAAPRGAPWTPAASAPNEHLSAPPPAKADHIAPPGAAESLEPPRAEEDERDDEDYDEDGKRRRRWYGWKTLVADGASITLLVTSGIIDTQSSNPDYDVLVTAALLGYAFAPGIIHFAHRNTGRGFASFGLRLGMPLAGIFIGAAAASGCDDYFCEAQGAAVGLALGVAGAIAIDAAVFAYDDVRPRSRGARLTPLLSLGPRRAWVGIGGEL